MSVADFSQRLLELKTQRGHVAAFGQTEKVKAIDAEIAELRRQHMEAVSSKAAKPAAEVETATADTSSVEIAAARKRKRS